MQTISEIRRDNLERLLAEVGTQAEIARRMNRSTKQVSQWFGKGSARDMSSVLARELEATFEKERGWMDNPETGRASQSVGFDIPTMRSAITLLQEVAKIRRTPPIPNIDPVALIVAYETVYEDACSMDDGNVLDFMQRFVEKLEKTGGIHGVERSKTDGVGAKAG